MLRSSVPCELHQQVAMSAHADGMLHRPQCPDLLFRKAKGLIVIPGNPLLTGQGGSRERA